MPAYPILITATDRASEKIEAIRKKVDEFNAPFVRLRRNLTKLADVSGLTKLAAGFRNVAAYALNAFRNIGRIVAPLGAITGAVTIAGMYRLIDSWAQFGQRLSFTGIRIGLTTIQLQGLEGAARLSGSTAAALDSGLQNLKDSMTDAIGGRNPEALLYFRTLGIEFRTGANQARDVVDVLPELADKIAAIKDPTLQARAATALLGGAGEQLLPFLRRGSAGIAEYVEMAKHYGVINADAAKSAIALRRAQTELSMALEGFTNTISVDLAPVLGPLLHQFAEWIATNREWIATGITDQVKAFAKFLQDTGWRAIGNDISLIAHGANDVAQALGGWRRTIEVIFALWLGSKFIAVLANLTKLALAVRAATVGTGALLGTGTAGGLGLGIGAGPAAAVTLPLALSGDSSQPAMSGDQIEAWKKQRDAADALIPTKSFWGQMRDWMHAGPRGMRNNNPLNLKYAGQADTIGQDKGGYGVYASMQSGIAAAERQLIVYQQAYGLTTLRQMISRWAPPGENNTAAYVADVSKTTGFDPDTPINMRDPAVAQAVLSAMAQHENGVALSAGMVAQGVSQALGQPAGVNLGGTAGAAGPSGTVDVNVRLGGAPAGTTVNARSSGGAMAGPPRVETAMPAAGP